MNKLYQRARKTKQQAMHFVFIIFIHVATKRNLTWKGALMYNYVSQKIIAMLHFIHTYLALGSLDKKDNIEKNIIRFNFLSLQQISRTLFAEYLEHYLPNIFYGICQQISCKTFVSWLVGFLLQHHFPISSQTSRQ